MPDEGGALLGDFGIADAACVAQLCNIEQSGEAIDEARWPKTGAYFAAHRAPRSVETSLQTL